MKLDIKLEKFKAKKHKIGTYELTKYHYHVLKNRFTQVIIRRDSHKKNRFSQMIANKNKSVQINS